MSEQARERIVDGRSVFMQAMDEHLLAADAPMVGDD